METLSRGMAGRVIKKFLKIILVLFVSILGQSTQLYEELDFVSGRRYENPEEKLVRNSDFVAGSRN
jgi:hypothetical protein